MNRAVRPVALPVLLFSVVLPGEVAGQLYHILPESRFEVRTGTAGLLGGLGDPHVIRAPAFEGSVCYVPDDPSRSWVRLEVVADSLRVQTPADEDDRASIREAMLTEVLRTDSFPVIRFRSTRVRVSEAGLEVEADLTLVGETRSVTVDLGLETAGAALWAWGRFSVRQTDFGIEPYSTALGTVRVADEITFYVEAEARRVEEGDERPKSCPPTPTGRSRP